MTITDTGAFTASGITLDDDLLVDFELRGTGANQQMTAQLVQAITGEPRLTRTIDGGSTVEIGVRDGSRFFINHPLLTTPCWAVVAGLNYQLVAKKKAGDVVRLIFEDSLVTALKNRKGAKKIEAGTMTRQQIAAEFVRDAGPIDVLLDPAARGVVNADVERSEDQSTWDVLTQLADEAGWRCFSDGVHLHLGSDEWLATLTQPIQLAEHTGPVHNVDFDADVAKAANSITLDVDAGSWALPPGRSFTITNLGLAGDPWVVTDFERNLTSLRATVTGQRRQLVLTEAPPQSAGESGEDTFLPEGGGDITADLARLRQCESGGNYKTNTGNGYYGAYQFDLRTWQGLGYSGRPDQASPATQDEAATKLYQKRGWKPWPACSKKLGLVDKRSSSGVTGSSTSTGNAARDRMIAWAMSKRGNPYVWGGKYDCSAFVRAATKDAGKELPGTSKGQYATCKAQGKLISVAEGLRTRGAILFRMSGDPTHVAISLGGDQTIEARGKAYGCNVFGGASKRSWTHAAIWL